SRRPAARCVVPRSRRQAAKEVAMKWKDDPVVAEPGQWQRDAIVEPASKQPRTEPLIVLSAGAALPSLLQASANPNSAGRYPIGRKYTVGDQATFRATHPESGALLRTFTPKVTRIDLESDRVELNDGVQTWDG